jgi:hypothetical protein
MKKSLDFVLILPLLLASIVFAARSGVARDWFAGTAFVTMNTRPVGLPPAANSPNLGLRIGTSVPAFTPIPANSATLTNVPPLTSTPTLEAVKTVTITPTEDPVSEEIDSGTARGTLIVQAIEAYYRDQHYYPPILADLVPVHLPELPVTSSGQPYFYRVFERTGTMASEIYWVSFRVTGEDHLTCTFYRRIQFWDCNYESP